MFLSGGLLDFLYRSTWATRVEIDKYSHFSVNYFGTPTAMGLRKNKYEQISVGHFCGKHAMANLYGTPKNKNKQISVGHFYGKHAMGAKNPANVLFLLFKPYSE